mmetsp:Transcript_14595/g.28422  ORF Transcript_14595/g.28422 Transcript_14595/m.28422 type:complete len:85 (-) Transcript_14595:22-276(-)
MPQYISSDGKTTSPSGSLIPRCLGPSSFILLAGSTTLDPPEALGSTSDGEESDGWNSRMKIIIDISKLSKLVRDQRSTLSSFKL